jgi:DNA-binding HxlR family transcriptional regulator
MDKWLLDLGGKWLIRIIIAMPLRGSRFTPLQNKLKISPSRLSENLLKLETLGYVKHLSPVERRHPLLPEYVLTDQGLRVKDKVTLLEALDDLIGIKWTIPILCVLYQGHYQFNDIKKILGMTPKMLSTRLRELEETGYIEKKVISDYPIQVHYSLCKDTRDKLDLFMNSEH